MKYFTSKKLNDHITLIQTITFENLFLVEGKNKAVLIDTSEGAGNLKEFVGKLTNKPITVILTHGHIDHAMGAVEFDDVFMNMSDKAVYDSMSDIPQRREYVAISAGLKELPEELNQSFVNADKAYEHFHDLKDNQEFDLGGIHIRAIHVPGHTPGMTMILLEEDRILITGDGANNATFLFANYCPSVKKYRDILQKALKRLQGKYDKVYISHHELEAPDNLLEQLISVCDDVLEDKSDAIPYNFMGQHALIAKAASPDFKRKDGKFGNLIYNPAKID